MNNRTQTIPLAIALSAIVVLSGCSTKAANDAQTTSKDGLKVDVGVTDTEISIGALTDTSGVFKASGIAYNAGNELWAKDVNATGGICGRQITLDIQDHGYKPDNALTQYQAMKGRDLAMVQMIGSPILAALKQQITNDKMLTIPAAWSSDNLDSESVLMIGQTYDVEMINGLAYLLEQGLISEGDTVGHVYVDSEYGLNALKGAQWFGEQHNITVLGAPVQSTDVDMTATITQFKSSNASAILVTTAPAATGSVVLQNVGQGLNVPVLGSSPTFSTTLLQDASVTAALSNFYSSYTFDAFGTGTGNPEIDRIEKEYAANYTDAPDDSITGGYASGLALQAVLEQACDNGDMSRAGVLEARKQLTAVDTKGITGKLDLSDTGAPTSREGMIMQIDPSAPVGLKAATGFIASEDAKAYRTPFQK